MLTPDLHLCKISYLRVDDNLPFESQASQGPSGLHLFVSHVCIGISAATGRMTVYYQFPIGFHCLPQFSKSLHTWGSDYGILIWHIL